MISFKQYLSEANLGGQSRSGADSNWNVYVKNADWKTMNLKFDKNAKIFDSNLKDVLLIPSVGDTFELLSSELTIDGKSNFANVSYQGIIGYTKITQIQKPNDKTLAGVVPGGKNSKAFTPDNLGLEGRHFNENELVSAIETAVKLKYGDDVFSNIRKYISDLVESITSQTLFEGKVSRFTKVIKMPNDYKIDAGDMKILSKNFGEVIGGLFLLATNKQISSVEFPSAVNEGLYDFVAIDKKNRKQYFSVKAGGGSSTSLANLDFVLARATTKLSSKYVKSIEKLMATKSNKNTVNMIVDFYNTHLQHKTNLIMSHLDMAGSEFTLDGIDQWLIDYKKNHSEPEFLELMKEVFVKHLAKRGATASSLKKIYNADKDPSGGGWLLYALGSFLVVHLNSDESALAELNDVMAQANFVSQLTADMTNKETKITILKMSKNQFRFSYNGMAMKPGNRPIGFKEI